MIGYVVVTACENSHSGADAIVSMAQALANHIGTKTAHATVGKIARALAKGDDMRADDYIQSLHDAMGRKFVGYLPRNITPCGGPVWSYIAQ